MSTKKIAQIRRWLSRVLGPTAEIERYTDEYVVRRARALYGFYGSNIVLGWGFQLSWL